MSFRHEGSIPELLDEHEELIKTAFYEAGCNIGQTARNLAKIPIEKFRTRIAGVQPDSFRRVLSRFIQSKRDKWQYGTDTIITDKKLRDFDWREAISNVQEMQRMYKDASIGQDTGVWKIECDEDPTIVAIGDLQLGSWGTDYDLFMTITEEILETPNLYVILLGDLTQMCINMRNVAEVMDNALKPGYQLKLLDGWLNEIKHKVISSVWDNHSVMREEKLVGYSEYAEIFGRHTMYHPGIGHLKIMVNKQMYEGAVTHRFRGKSHLNPMHAPMRYMRHEANWLDFAMQGDYHVPGWGQWYEGGKQRSAIVCGSIQTRSLYARRHFSLTTYPQYPCMSLSRNEHEITVYKSVKNWLRQTGKPQFIKN